MFLQPISLSVPRISCLVYTPQSGHTSTNARVRLPQREGNDPSLNEPVLLEIGRFIRGLKGCNPGFTLGFGCHFVKIVAAHICLLRLNSPPFTDLSTKSQSKQVLRIIFPTNAS